MRKCYIKSNKNDVISLSVVKNISEINEELIKNLKYNLFELELEWFFKYNKISIDDANNLIVTQEEQKIKEIFEIENKDSEIIVSKWRSAETQCVEIEESYGNNAIDVSLKNLGYDIESITHTGEKNYY